MNDSISKEIESIKDNLNILPKRTKDNINKYNDYIDDKLVIYHNYLNDIKSEIDKRVSSIKKKYFGNDYVLRDSKLDILELKVMIIQLILLFLLASMLIQLMVKKLLLSTHLKFQKRMEHTIWLQNTLTYEGLW